MMDAFRNIARLPPKVKAEYAVVAGAALLVLAAMSAWLLEAVVAAWERGTSCGFIC